MDVEDWIKVGPGYRLQNGNEAEVLATDNGGDWPIAIRHRAPNATVWQIGERRCDGSARDRDLDLIRPVEVSDEAVAAYEAAFAVPTARHRDGLAAAFAVMLRERGLE